MSTPIQFAVLTSSDSGHAGSRADNGGDAVLNLMAENGHALVERRLEPDEEPRLVGTLSEWCGNDKIQLILTTGGTGLASRDVMPEATRRVIDYEVPGMAEAMRAASLEVDRDGNVVSRRSSVLRTVHSSSICPGIPKALSKPWKLVLPVLPHAHRDIERYSPR